MSRLLIVMTLLSLPKLSFGEITGDWFGVLKVQGVQLRMVLHISNAEQGLVTTLDSPDQGAFGLPVAKTTYNELKLSLEFTNLRAQFEGQLKQDSLLGFWLQAGRQFPLHFGRKAKKLGKLKRPQEPSLPLPYQVEEVRFENVRANLELAGTLTLPKDIEKPPVAILISGSGPQDRNESIAGHKPFLVLADHLTRQGIAVLRYDDRGTAQSTGNHSKATTADFATDVESAVQFLLTRTDIDAAKIGLIGHSEGGIIAPMVVARSKQLAFMVLLASTGVSGKELSLMQAQSLRTFEVPDEEAFMAFNERAIDLAASDEDLEVVQAQLAQHYNGVRSVMASMMPEGSDLDAFIGQQVSQMTSPWSRFFYNYNPADELEKIKDCPVLSLNGTRDLQVLADVNQDGIKKALEKAGNKDVTIVEIEKLNHLFQECETGAMSEYGQIEQTFSPTALSIISDWIQSKTQ